MPITTGTLTPTDSISMAISEIGVQRTEWLPADRTGRVSGSKFIAAPAIISPIDRFPLIVETLTRLRSRSCIIDGEAVACDDNGVTLFNRVRYRRHDEAAFCTPLT
jgi:hypothetical protein